MAYILQVDFPYTGPWGNEMAAAMQKMAQSIAEESGLLWKIWTENREANEAGGIYLFADQSSAEAYLVKHSTRLQGFGVTGVNGKIFAVNQALSEQNRAPL